MAAAELFIERHGYATAATDEDLEAITRSIVDGDVEVEALAIWLRQRLVAEPGR